MLATTTHDVKVAPIAASTPGALSGFEMTCSCGDRQTTSLSENVALNMAAKHVDWWAKR